MTPPCKCKPMQSTTLGKSLCEGIVGLQVNFCGCCKWKVAPWKDLDWIRNDTKIARQFGSMAAALMWCGMKIWLYIFNTGLNNFAFSVQFQKRKRGTSTKASSIVILGGIRGTLIPTLCWMSFCYLSFHPHFDWQRERGADGERWA